MQTITIDVGARSSPLSQAQVQEVQRELQKHHPGIVLKPILVSTTGDQDHSISLRTLGRTDFFTKEVDALLLAGQCRIAIHSAKDLPEPIPDGLRVIAITQGVDSADVLVLRPQENFAALRSGALIATSSERREEAVRQLRGDLKFIDIRGTIGERLAKLDNGEADGVVVAEAALIRLGLTHLNRIRLPGSTSPLQGQLAILSRDHDTEMVGLFSCLNCCF